MTTDTTERGLERLICTALAGHACEPTDANTMQLPDTDAEIDPIPSTGGGRKPEPELDLPSNILKEFNDLFGHIGWADEDHVRRLITKDIPNTVAEDEAYSNARKNADAQNTRIEHVQNYARTPIVLMWTMPTRYHPTPFSRLAL